MQKLNIRILLTAIGMSVFLVSLFFVNLNQKADEDYQFSETKSIQITLKKESLKGVFVKSDKNEIEILPDYIIQRQNWEYFLANHPYSKTPHKTDEEWKEIPKADRPDLSAQLDFFKTVDPALGYVPYSRLKKASDEMWEMINDKAAISGVTWTERGPDNVGGRSRALMFDPNDGTNKKVWSGGVAGGLWYTDDITVASPSWIKVDDFWSNLAVSCIAYNPANTQEFYVGTGEGFFNADAIIGDGIWKTSDGGTTWSQLATTVPGAYPGTSNFYYVNDIEVNSSGVIFAAFRGYYINRGGIYRSTDGGSTWTKVLAPYSGIGVTANTNVYDWGADIEIAQNDDIYATCGLMSNEGHIYRSTDGGNNWTDITSTVGSTRIELAIAPSTGATTATTTIYAVAEGGSGNNDIGWFMRSTNGGSSWSNITIPLMVDGTGNHFTRAQAWYDLILDVHPTDPNLVIAGGIDLHRTTNGGSSWTGISHWYGGFGEPYVHADQHAIEFRPGSPNEVIFGNDGGVHFSTDAGNSASNPTFSDKNSGFNITQFYACATKNEINSHYFLAGAQDNGSQQFTQAGVNSTTEVTGGDGAFCHIDALNPDIQITAYVYNNLYYSQDGGNTFNTLLSSSTGHFINPSDYDSQRKILYSAYNNDGLVRITNIDGSPSAGALAVSFGGAQASAFKVSPYNDVVFIGVENGRVYKMTNASGSPTYTRIDNGTIPITATGWVSSIDVGANDNQLLVTYSNYGVVSVWETTDGGTNWYNKEGNLPDMPIRWAIYNPNDRNDVLCATELGVWSTDNFQPGTSNAPTYGPSNTGLANTRCDMLELRPVDDVVVVATHGRGLFTTDIFVSTPSADFIANPKISCTGSLNVQFTDASIKPNSDWAWDIDNDGSTDYTTQNPSHLYNTDGLYSVELEIDGGAASVTKNNLILVMSGAPTPCTGCSFSGNSNLGNTYGIGLFTFELENINYPTPNDDGEYHDYTCSAFTNLDLNTMYNVSVQTGVYNDEAAKVYIDYNNDGNFGAGEEIASFPANQAGYRTLSFTTPSGGVVMNTGLRLRVVSKYNSSPTDACNTSTYGQAEDYTVYFYDASTLPVELISFTAECTNEGSKLLWSTASEQNNMQFEIERSADLRNWKTIAIIPGAGNSNEMIEYSYLDPQGSDNLYYYRLKQLDFNGKQAYSPLATSDCISFEGLSDLSIQPNPVADNLNIVVTTALDEGAIVYIQDMFGKLVLQENAELMRGENALVFDVSFLNPGTYILVVQTEKGGIEKTTLIKE